jgi:DNA-binding response OmpR family regulator
VKDDRFANLTILCVEDEPGVRKRLVNTLEFYFKRVYEAQDGFEGWKMYEECQPDVILCDIQMPKCDGIELVKKIRQEDFNRPIVMLTAYANEFYLLELVNLHIHHYLVKPINRERLIQGLEIALRGYATGKIRICSNLILDLDNFTLMWDDKKVTLSKREASFIALLERHNKNVVSYAMIEEHLWNNRPMSQDALKSFVRDLRKKLPFDIIQNVSQVGYRIIREE